MNFDYLINFILNPDFTGWLLIFKIIFIVLTFVILIFIIFILLKTTWLKYFIISDLIEFFTYRPYGLKKFAKQWLKIITHLEAGSEAECKLAIIEADSLLDEILEKDGYSGETLEDKLKLITPIILSNFEEVKSAHKIRNNIVHDPNYRLSLDETRKTLSIYEKALTDLEAI